MADSTLTIRIVSQTPSASQASPAATQLQPNGNPKAITPQPAPSPQTRSSPTQQTLTSTDRSLASLALGLVAHQTFSSATNALATIPGQTKNASRLQNIGGGAIAGATAGAAFGPAGIAIGATIGAASGALKSLADEAKSTRDALQSLKDASRLTSLSTGAKRQDQAFLRTLQYMSPDEREQALVQRATQIKNGNGDASIRNLTNAIREMAKAGLTDTPQYKEKQNLLALQKNRLATLQELDDKNTFQNLPKLLNGSEHADALQKIGATVGQTIDINATNREQIDLLREIASATRSLASQSTDSSSSLNNASGPAVFLP